MDTGELRVKVYWRPGCGACRSLRVALAEAGVPAEWHNVWEDRSASAIVRGAAGGNETVPTKFIDGRAYVAQSPRRAVEEIGRAAPGLVRRTTR
ncbi:MAG: glutaredoxin domain-containing protein [Acidimicrobiia bacterium]